MTTEKTNPTGEKLYSLITAALFLVLGWLITGAQSDTRELRARVVALEASEGTTKADMATNYVRKEDYRADLREIKSKLDQLIDRMDRKVDKK